MRLARGRRRLPELGRSAALHLARRIAAGGLAAAAAVLLAGPLSAIAQEARAIAIRIPASIVAKAETDAVLPIEIGPSAAIPARSFVSVRGLPPAVGLQDAHAVGPGWWAVPLSALPAVNAAIPAGLSGQSEIVVSLIATDGQLLAQARSMLVIGSGTPTPAGVAALSQRSSAAASDKGSEEDRARAERMLARGEAYLANGNIIGARDFFERAADAGLAASALRLAATYDPVMLQRMKAQGVAPDPGLARKWYARARDLGSTEAAEPLTRLGAE